MKQILEFFPNLSPKQQEQLAYLGPFYKDWNAKINLVSRKDIDQLYLHHILHSMSIAKVMSFKPYTEVLDVGTGGGFPGIPLAILFPQARFTLIDSTLKKIKVVQTLVDELSLPNVEALHKRAQQMEEKKFDFMVSRGVTKLEILTEWAQKTINPEHYNELANGLLILKGGNLKEEIKPLQQFIKKFAINKYFPLERFNEKYVIHIPVREKKGRGKR